MATNILGRRCFFSTDEELIRRVVDMVKNGTSMRKAGAILNISKTTVHTIMKKYKASAGPHFLDF